MEKIRTKYKETTIIDEHGKTKIEKLEFYKAKSKKFIKFFNNKTSKKYINKLTTSEKGLLISLFFYIDKNNIFYLLDLEKKDKKKFLNNQKNLLEKNIIKKIKNGKYIINPYIIAIGYDIDIKEIIENFNKF